jgi:hypothetical protein
MIVEKLGEYAGKLKREITNELKVNDVALDCTGQPEDVANLINQDSDYMTGQNIMINGGKNSFICLVYIHRIKFLLKNMNKNIQKTSC